MPSGTVSATDGRGRPRAVAVGFEPTNGLHRYTLSRNALLPTPSASSRYRPSSPEGSDRRLSVNCTQAEMQDVEPGAGHCGSAWRGRGARSISRHLDGHEIRPMR